jgi:hypothetical protein
MGNVCRQKKSMLDKLLVLIIVSSVLVVPLDLASASEPNEPIPKSWKVIAKSQGGEIFSPAVRGKWLAWLERRRDPDNMWDRARPCFFGLYRKQIGSDEIETLSAPVDSRTGPDQYVLGPDGTAAHDYQQERLTLHVPRNSELFVLHEKRAPSDRGWYFPLRIYEGALLCYDPTLNRIFIIPLSAEGPELNRQVGIDVSGELVNRTAFWNGGSILYTDTFTKYYPERRPLERREYEYVTVLHDLKRKQAVWSMTRKFTGTTMRVAPLALNEQCAYYCTAEYSVFGEILRRSVEQKAGAERLILPAECVHLVDCAPECLLGVMKESARRNGPRGEGIYERFFVAALDFVSGTIAEYDFSEIQEPPSMKERSLREYIEIERWSHYPGSHIWMRYQIVGDAESEQIIGVANNKIYLVPKLQDKSIEWPSFGWRATVPD